MLSTTSCVLLLLNGNLSHGYYEASSQTFKCKLPGGALSSRVEVSDRVNALGETVTFSLDLGLLWRIDHLRLDKHKLATIDTSADRRIQLDQAKENYMNLYLSKHADQVDIDWEQYSIIEDKEVLLVSAYVKWADKQEQRELLFSLDGNYVNVVHFAQNLSTSLQSFTTSAAGFYQNCEFY